MRQTFILLLFLPILILLLFHNKITVAAAKSKAYCSSTKNWACNLTETLEAPNWVKKASKDGITQSIQLLDVNDLFLHTAYQTPVDDQTGKLYVALRLDWRLNNDFIQSKNVTFWLQINQFEHNEAISTIYMKIYGFRNDEIQKKGRISFHTDFQAFIEKKLQIGQSYDLTLVYKTDDESRTLTSTRILVIPTIHLDAEDNRPIKCDSEHIEKSRRIAARWVSALYTKELHIGHAVVVSFFAAPKWFCFDSYEINLLQYDVVVKSATVTNDKLYRNGSNWMANVSFTDVAPNVEHVITIKASEHRKDDDTTCLCRISSSCDCVLAGSKPFSLIDTGKNVYGKVLEERIRARQRTKAAEKKTETKEMKPLIIVFLIFSIIAAILIIIFLLLCVYRMLKQTSKWQKTLLLKTSGSGESLTPLIKNPPVQRIFILNPNPEKDEFVTEIAHFLQSKGLTVFYFNFDSKQLEENAFYYVHKAIGDSDKIILFHGNRTQKFIDDGRVIRETIASNYYDNAFIIALSLLKLNDSKILHANFIDDKLAAPTKLLITETIYSLPRDLAYLFQGIQLQADQSAIANLNEAYFIQKEKSDTNELESILSTATTTTTTTTNTSSPESIRKDEEQKEEESVMVINNNNNNNTSIDVEIIEIVGIKGKSEAPDSSNTDSGFHSM